MKKLILFATLLISIASKAQYGGCEFTASPDSSCIELGTTPLARPDTLERTRGRAPIGKGTRTSRKWFGFQQFMVTCWKSSTAISPSGNINWTDSITGLTYTSYKIPNSRITGLATVATSGSYNDLTDRPTIPNGQIQSDYAQTNSSAVDFIKNKPVGSTTYTTRTINSSSYTPSSTQNYRVYYTIEISCTASIGSASAGEVVLQYFDGSIWQNSAAQIKNSNTVTLAVVLNSVTIQKCTISEEFPANTQLRLVPTTTGTTTITFIKGKEILY